MHIWKNLGAPIFYFLQISQNFVGFRQNNSQIKAFRKHKTQKIFFFFFLFTIYQNYAYNKNALLR